VEGESHIPEMAGKVRHVWLEPNNPPAFPKAIKALLSADLIVIGPGSLYTSLLPNLLVPDLAEAVRASRGLKIYVCNVATQPGETEGFGCGDHIQALVDHVGDNLFELVVANQRYQGDLPDNIQWVNVDDSLDQYYAIYRTDVIDEEIPWRHDADKLAQVLMDLLQERTGPLVE